MGANNFDRRDFLITGCAVAAFAATPIAAATPSDAILPLSCKKVSDRKEVF